jgi:hypothetical protein
MNILKSLLIFLTVMGNFYNCSSTASSKETNTASSIEKSNPNPKISDAGDDSLVEIRKPFTGKEFQNDEKHFRAVSSSESENLSFASEKALLQAKQRLASLIENTIKSVSDRYAQERQLSDKAEFQEKMENLTRSVVNQKLKKVNVLGDKTFQMKDKKRYIAWVAIEMPVASLLPDIEKVIEQKITKDEKLLQDYDKMKFEETFNDEMEKLEKTQSK